MSDSQGQHLLVVEGPPRMNIGVVAQNQVREDQPLELTQSLHAAHGAPFPCLLNNWVVTDP